MVLTPVAWGNVVGTDTQNFNPTTSGLDFVTVQSSETLEPGFVNMGFFLNYAVNTLPYFDSGDGSRSHISDSILGADLNVGIGLLPSWDVGFSFPQLLFQEVKNKDGSRGQFAQNGATEVRVNSKYRLVGDRNQGIAVIGSANINRIKNNPFIGKDAGPTYNAELAFDTMIDKLALGLNVGRRWRKPGPQIEPEIVPMRDQWIASAAASYLFSSIDTKLILEVFGSKPVKDQTDVADRLAQTAETLLGIKHDINHNLALHAGFATENEHGQASPDWRLYAGVNWATGPKIAKAPAPQKQVITPAPAKPYVPAKDPFAGPPKAREKIIIHDVLFEFDSDSMILKGAEDTMQKLVGYLNMKPAFQRLIIEGHTDSVGSDAYNDRLSQRRAQTIKRILVNRYKLDPRKIVAVGRGERSPIADNGNYQGRQLNRRVEFTIFRNMK